MHLSLSCLQVGPIRRHVSKIRVNLVLDRGCLSLVTGSLRACMNKLAWRVANVCTASASMHEVAHFACISWIATCRHWEISFFFLFLYVVIWQLVRAAGSSNFPKAWKIIHDVIYIVTYTWWVALRVYVIMYAAGLQKPPRKADFGKIILKGFIELKIW